MASVIGGALTHATYMTYVLVPKQTMDAVQRSRVWLMQSFAECSDALPAFAATRGEASALGLSFEYMSLLRNVHDVALPVFAKPDGFAGCLDEEQESEVARAMEHAHAADAKPLVFERTGVATVTLPLANLSDFDAGQWLGDESIRFYMAMLQAHVQQCKERGVGSPLVFLMNSYWYTYMAAGDSVDRWTKRCVPHVFAMDYVVIPINLHNQHWICIVVDFVNKRFIAYDSTSRGQAMHHDKLNLTRTWLQAEHVRQLQSDLDLSSWANEHSGTPAQTDEFNCGVFVCQYTKGLCKGIPANFTSRHCPGLRSAMVYEILTQELL